MLQVLYVLGLGLPRWKDSLLLGSTLFFKIIYFYTHTFTLFLVPIPICHSYAIPSPYTTKSKLSLKTTSSFTSFISPRTAPEAVVEPEVDAIEAIGEEGGALIEVTWLIRQRRIEPPLDTNSERIRG